MIAADPDGQIRPCLGSRLRGPDREPRREDPGGGHEADREPRCREGRGRACAGGTTAEVVRCGDWRNSVAKEPCGAFFQQLTLQADGGCSRAHEIVWM